MSIALTKMSLQDKLILSWSKWYRKFIYALIVLIIKDMFELIKVEDVINLTFFQLNKVEVKC